MRGVLIGVLCAGAIWGAERRLAITVDDLPVAQSGARACEYARLREFTGRFLKNLEGNGRR